MRNLFPDAVEKVVHDLSQDEDVNEIWLIGSQASGYATEQSDWDLLVIARREPEERTSRSTEVDVLWCGPSGSVLLEGQPKALEFEFSDFHWEEYEEGCANYRGRKFRDVMPGTVRDATEPLQKFIDAKAVRLWKANQEHG